MSVVIVDDSDARIQYNPSTGWRQSNHFEQYLTTSTGATGSGINQTASFSFQGTSVAIYGTVNQGRSTMSFSLDRGPPSTYDIPSFVDSATHHQLFFASDTLADGQHTVIMTQASGVNLIFLDYLLYNTTSSAGNTLFFDDRDSRLEYSGENWDGISGPEQWFQTTSRNCGADECTVALNFDGNSLSVYGDFSVSVEATSAPPGFNASITVDGGPPTPIQFSARFVSPQPTSNFQIYSTQLTPGNHRAVLTTHETDQFRLDYFVADVPAAPTVPDPSSSSSIQATSTPDASNLTASPLQVASSSKHIPVAVVVGGVIAAVVFLCTMLLLFILWRRRVRRRAPLEPFTEHLVDETVYPYDPSTPPPAYRKFVPSEMVVESNPMPSSSNFSRTQNRVGMIPEKNVNSPCNI